MDQDVTISGPGANNLAVDGNAQSRVFYINPGKTVTISGLTITNGNVTNDGGGGIYNDGGALTLSDCTVSGNSAITAAASPTSAPRAAATMTVSNCTVSGNSGGGIGNGGFGDSATMTVSNSTVSGNSGGGIGNGAAFIGGSAALTVTNSTISGNSGSGGGIAATIGSATVTITNSTLSGNSADLRRRHRQRSADKGQRAIVIVSNSTISGNSADYGGGGIANGSTVGGGSA